MRIPGFKYPDTRAYNYVTQTIRNRGVTQRDMGQIVHDMTKEFVPEITLGQQLRTKVRSL